MILLLLSFGVFLLLCILALQLTVAIAYIVCQSLAAIWRALTR